MIIRKTLSEVTSHRERALAFLESAPGLCTTSCGATGLSRTTRPKPEIHFVPVSARIAESTFAREKGSRRFREIEAFLPKKAVEPRLLSFVVEFFDKA